MKALVAGFAQQASSAGSELPVPRVVLLTAAMFLIAAAMAGFVRGVRAPIARPLSIFGLLVGFVATGFVVAAVLSRGTGFPHRALAAAAFTAGLGHAAYFRFAALPSQSRLSRGLLCRVGQWAGFLGALALWMEAPPRLLVIGALLLSAAAVAAWLVVVPAGRRAPRSADGAPCVRFPCPRCGTVGDWGEGVSPCAECGLFVHLFFDPEDAGPALFAPEDPPPGRTVRFACLGCGAVGDWVQGHTLCGSCERRVRLHWNVHVGPQAEAEAGTETG